MSEQPVPISEIDNPDDIRVVLYQSGRMVHAPLVAVSPAQGDFTGPASSTADNIVTFADATGKLGKDSGVAVASLAPLASPTLTGTPAAPTAAPGTNTTQISTTAFVTAAAALLAPLASPALTGNPTAPTAAPGDNDTTIATTAFVQAAIPAAPTVIFTEAFESTQQTITTSGALTLAHGLSSQPKLYIVVLQCLTAEHNYSIGDETAVVVNNDVRGISVVPDATNINIRYGNTAVIFRVINKTTGALASATNANWAMVVRAWA